jgi:hypothetical protein
VVRHGALDAALDAGRIRRWWRRAPLANLGVATGTASRLVVLDVDPRHDGPAHLAQLEGRYRRLPATVEAVSGGGGRHLYFAHAGDPIPTAAGLLGGLDVRGDGGYIVAPPSRHASGGRYRWRPSYGPSERAPAALPAWLAHLARHGGEPAGALRGRRPLAPASPADRRVFRELMAEIGVTPRSGNQEMHRCPWHPDEHPSLSVHWGAAVFHCFGCEVGGGIGTLRAMLRERGWPW